VDHPDPERGEEGGQPDRLALGGDRAVTVVGALLDERDHHERPVAEGRLLADLAPCPIERGRSL